jgi:hypothetical protein
LFVELNNSWKLILTHWMPIQVRKMEKIVPGSMPGGEFGELDQLWRIRIGRRQAARIPISQG